MATKGFHDVDKGPRPHAESCFHVYAVNVLMAAREAPLRSGADLACAVAEILKGMHACVQTQVLMFLNARIVESI
eukprot:6176323-Pleurochrysis_carterae.AAC.1